MSITEDTTLLAPPRAKLGQIQEAFLARPTGSYGKEEVRRIIWLYWTTCRPVGLDPLLAAAQMYLETGHLTSPWSQPPNHNFAGIGVTGLPGAGVRFPNEAWSVRAHAGRLLAYALRAGDETTLQRHLVAEALSWRPLPDSRRGVAPTLGGLEGTWALSAGYASHVAEIANRIAGTGADDPLPGAPRIITAREMGLSFRMLYGELGREEHVTGHYTAGARASDAEEGVERLRAIHRDHDKWGGTGYHFCIVDNGTLLCARPTLLKGAHTAYHNTGNIGVVCPGSTGDRPTPQQAATFRWLLANAHTDAMPAPHRTDRDLREAKRWGHKQWADNATSCPGEFLQMYLSGGDVRDLAPPPPVEEPGPLPPPELVGNMPVDHEHISRDEAEAAIDPESTDPWLPPSDPRFDGEEPDAALDGRARVLEVT